ncbi:MAG: tRNA epoxyqueuosine(34) reductase QueG [Oligoflexia bacterium]|nr:tRNA epoxyqueuosine(34) reductase QueG [Oligoflexia bacterium]
MTPTMSYEDLAGLCQQVGLRVYSLTHVAPLNGSVKPLKKWVEAGYEGDMAYMRRPPELLCEPHKLLPCAKSILTVAVDYAKEPHPACPPGWGRVARYAWGLDYHIRIPEMLAKLVELVAERCEGLEARYFSDAVPLLERAIAQRAGIGFIGKNCMLIRPGEGSFCFLAEVIWNLDVSSDSLPSSAGHCGRCTRCLAGCPTGAIVGERVLDARRCISYLTIEKRGLLDAEESANLGQWVFGCDICQDVCPFNHRALNTQSSEEDLYFSKEHGVGPLINLSELLAIRRDEQFKQRFSRTALLRSKRVGLLRNAASVAGNTLAEKCEKALIDAAVEDASEVVRVHAIRALDGLCRAGLVASSVVRGLAEKENRSTENPRVRSELESMLG